MAGKSIDNDARAVASPEVLRAALLERYQGVLFEVPGYNGLIVELARLKRREREEIIRAAQRPDGTWDNMLQNRMAVAFGMLQPKVTAEELLNYPDDFIDPIAAEVWKMSNNDELAAKGGAESDPFPKTSGSTTGSSTGPTSILTSSKRGPIGEKVESSSGI